MTATLPRPVVVVRTSGRVVACAGTRCTTGNNQVTSPLGCAYYLTRYDGAGHVYAYSASDALRTARKYTLSFFDLVEK